MSDEESEEPSFSITSGSQGQSHLKWARVPSKVMVFYKPNEVRVIKAFKNLTRRLIECFEMAVFLVDHRIETCTELCEGSTLEDIYLKNDETYSNIYSKLNWISKEDATSKAKIDLIICLGGDGTLLYVSDLFQESVPPIMSFHMGSLGFLTPFKFKTHPDSIAQVLRGGVPVIMRQRLKCIFTKAQETENHSNHSNLSTTKHVLNEVVVDRGSAGHLCNLNLFVDSLLVTCVQGDGVIISTPTGSTAYATAAGSSMVHPNVPGIVVVPVCPHSLSFRPIVLPADREIKIMLSRNARGSAMVSLDGRQRCEMKQGDSIYITASQYPVPSLCAIDPIFDWFSSLATCLHWNIRKLQKPLRTRPHMDNGVGSDEQPSNKRGRSNTQAYLDHLVQHEESEDEEDDDEVDISGCNSLSANTSTLDEDDPDADDVPSGAVFGT